MPDFMKRYTDAPMAARAVQRSVALRQHGVATPRAVPGPDPLEVRFDRIEGATGRALIGANMAPLLQALASLPDHPVPGEDLPRFDPLLRIRPRMALTAQPLFRSMLEELVPQGHATLHGDLHVGQFIRAPSGAVWIIDLDDLAIGPREADLANFAAHLATTVPEGGIADWAARICAGWAALGHPVNGPVFAQYLRFALLRRHLKLRAAGRDDKEAEILAYLRDSSILSMR